MYGILDRSLLDKKNFVWPTEEQCDLKVRRFRRSLWTTINVVVGESDGGVEEIEEQKETRERKREKQKDPHLNRFPKAVGSSRIKRIWPFDDEPGVPADGVVGAEQEQG